MKKREYKVIRVDGFDTGNGLKVGDVGTIKGLNEYEGEVAGRAVFEFETKSGFNGMLFEDQVVPNWREWGFLFRWGSVWVGCHYLKFNRRYCINLIPCVTFWITKKGGKRP